MDYLGRVFESDKAKTALIDAVASTVLLVASRFLPPADADFMVKLVAIYQPLFLVMFVQSAQIDKLRTAFTILSAKRK